MFQIPFTYQLGITIELLPKGIFLSSKIIDFN